jgi:hypothetical protein
MDITTLIRELIDKLESIAGQHEAPEDDMSAPHDSECGSTDDEQPLMTPPQTQKLELLKKAVGVESAYDEDEDEIAVLKRRAGINPATLDSLADDILD